MKDQIPIDTPRLFFTLVSLSFFLFSFLSFFCSLSLSFFVYLFLSLFQSPTPLSCPSVFSSVTSPFTLSYLPEGSVPIHTRLLFLFFPFRVVYLSCPVASSVLYSRQERTRRGSVCFLLRRDTNGRLSDRVGYCRFSVMQPLALVKLLSS